ncbi:hypothetical protein CDO73_02820 [Saccharibacillus sp. O23]|uniref:alpha/beta hydrolase n=1 Tax=Saccharibacillus sp. O23 TaxID=2009338 RepID=UPI000B4E44F4|nr:alpha/beta hydrolase [Saccharibacillus sp. O23]OWR32553.1 hypothetical protein CDO73_02820 [Saccharibacillus sp. O23]
MTSKLSIWRRSIPYNTGQSKYDELELRNENPSKALAGIRALAALKRPYAGKRRHRIHEATYAIEIQGGEAAETYDDVPCLIPYLAEGSDRAVIIVPGGGYVTRSVKHEGEGIARSLNEAGISAFVLEYRLNPYKAPVPFLDLQRSVRYVRSHARQFGLHPQKIGVLGFSAGGHMAAVLMTLLRGSSVNAQGYDEDDIDRADDRPDLAGLVYPLLDCGDLPSVAVSLFHKEDAEDERTRKRLLDHYSPAQHVRPGDPPQFLCFGDNDMLIGSRGILDYKRSLDDNGVPNRLLTLEGANHGFGDCEANGLAERLVVSDKYAYWKKAFADWANAIFDGDPETPSSGQP